MVIPERLAVTGYNNSIYKEPEIDYHLQPFRGVLFPRVLCVRSLLTFKLIPGFLGSFPSIYSTEVLGVEYVEFPAVCLLRRAGQRIPV